MTHYESFLQAKLVSAPAVGFDVESDNLHPCLKPFQNAAVRWMLRRGRAAAFEGTGLGKTFQQLEFGRQVHRRTNGDVLILAPLAVSHQTVQQGDRWGIPVNQCRKQADVKAGLNISNYEMLDHFDSSKFSCVVIDESGILKSFMGATKRAICDAFKDTPYRLAATATPAPNDHLELGNHAEFLGVMDSNEMISRWFINDTMASGNYRLKGHAAQDFWRWVATWAICITKPSDLGFSDDGYDLPPNTSELFRNDRLTATTLHKEMRVTCNDRAAKLASIVNAEPDEPWLIWCNTNYETEAVRKLIPNAVEVRGSDKDSNKAANLIGFADGTVKMLVTKPRIAGFGMNYQHCARVAFVGLSYSFEQTYQAVRRCWRFGQTRPVECHFICANTEGDILKVQREKNAEHEKMQVEMAKAMKAATLSEMGMRRTLSNSAGGSNVRVPNWL